MLRTYRCRNKADICWKDCTKIHLDKAAPEGKSTETLISLMLRLPSKLQSVYVLYMKDIGGHLNELDSCFALTNR